MWVACLKMKDPCLQSLRNLMDACRMDPCSSECCNRLSQPLKRNCESYWSNAYAHFVLTARKVPCQSKCPTKPMCFFGGDDTPCFDSKCAPLFTKGDLSRECDTVVMNYCRDLGVRTQECNAYVSARKKCGAEGMDWASCAAVDHSTADFIHDLKEAGKHERRIENVHAGATEWISNFGLTASPWDHTSRKCVIRFPVEDASRMVPCAFTTTISVNDVSPIVDVDNVFGMIWIVFTLMVYLVRMPHSNGDVRSF